MFDKNFYLALGSFVGAIVGVGIFGIPYVVSRTGFLLERFILLFCPP